MPRQRPRLVVINIWEDTALWLMARIKGNSGTNINQASVSGISVKVFDATNNNTETYSGTLTVSEVVFDDLQTADTRWTADTTGYNFGATIPAEAFASGGSQYVVEVLFTPTSGANYVLVAQVLTDELLTS